MIAKVIVGKVLGGCVRYLLEREQSAVLDSAGVRDYDIKGIISDFNVQRKMRPQLGNAVGHMVPRPSLLFESFKKQNFFLFRLTKLWIKLNSWGEIILSI